MIMENDTGLSFCFYRRRMRIPSNVSTPRILSRLGSVKSCLGVYIYSIV